MQLTGPEILRRINTPNPKNPNNAPDIVITPFHQDCLGSNSYDLHLGNKLKIYRHTLPKGMKPALEYRPGLKMSDWFEDIGFYKDYLCRPQDYDPRNPQFALNPCDAQSHETIEFEIPETGLLLSPTIGYLGSTIEYTETRNLFPYIDGKSSVGRNFILNHHTAGRGDDGFCGQWTLEIATLYPTVVFPYMRIGQIYYEEFSGARKPYDQNTASHYNGQQGPTPAAIIPIDKFIKQR
ncbi:MAG: hypothetical protein NC311_01620 [Muribaculaceae bacterium]|nr:hypothetical protein [Muribaculaceae bacterium]